jgi:hypothetical protein
MRLATASILLLALTACNRPPAQAPGETAPAPSGPVAAAAEPAVDRNCAFCADPGYVRTCEIAQGVRTTLYWNLEDRTSGAVDIFVVDDAGKDSPFAQQPPRGSIETGPWLRPGLTFKVKDSEGKVLESLEIAGRDC